MTPARIALPTESPVTDERTQAMAIRASGTEYVVDCNHCPESLDNGDLVMTFNTPTEANQAAIDNGWNNPAPGRHTCPDDDTANSATGGTR